MAQFRAMENFRHLGGNPEPWEVAQGTIAERTAAVGRSAIDFRAKTSTGDGSTDSKAWVKVASLGREAMALVLGREDPLALAPADSLLIPPKEALDDDADEPDLDDDPASDIAAILDADYDTSSWTVRLGRKPSRPCGVSPPAG